MVFFGNPCLPLQFEFCMDRSDFTDRTDTVGCSSKRSKFGVGGFCRLDLFSLNKIFVAIILRR